MPNAHRLRPPLPFTRSPTRRSLPRIASTAASSPQQDEPGIYQRGGGDNAFEPTGAFSAAGQKYYPAARLAAACASNAASPSRPRLPRNF